jgi:hypothetical protein
MADMVWACLAQGHEGTFERLKWQTRTSWSMLGLLCKNGGMADRNASLHKVVAEEKERTLN